MFWNLGSIDDRLFDDFRRIQREMDELFGSGPARVMSSSGTPEAWRSR